MPPTTTHEAIERIENGIAAYRQYRRARRNAIRPAAGGSGDGTLQRTTKTIRPGDELYETTLYEVDAPADGPTVFVMAGQQGFERSGVNAADIVRQLTPTAGTLVVVPMANQHVHGNVSRNDSYKDPYYGENMNREWVPGERPNSRIAAAIWDHFTSYDVNLAFDLHSSKGIYNVDPGRVGQAIWRTPDERAQDAAVAVRTALNEDYLAQYPSCYEYEHGSNRMNGSDPMFGDKVHEDTDASSLMPETTRDFCLMPRPPQTLWHVATVVRAAETVGMAFEEAVDDVAPTASRSPPDCATCDGSQRRTWREQGCVSDC